MDWQNHLKAVTLDGADVYLQDHVAFGGGAASGMGRCPKSMGNHCCEVLIYYDIDCARRIQWRPLHYKLHGALLQTSSLICIPLFKLIQRTAIVSSGHPWLLRSILCQPLGMLAAQRLVDYQRRAGFPALEHIHVPVMCQMPRP